MNNIKKALKRNPNLDYPVYLNFELIGNDVCNGHAGFDHMTKPEDFKAKILDLWHFIDTVIPKGSHLTVTGIADGRVLYNILSDSLHPIGIKYPVFYDFLNCVEVSPCWGWMNSNETARNMTS